MKIVLHDYQIGQFYLELASELADRGHEMSFCYSGIDSNLGDASWFESDRMKLVEFRGASVLNKSDFVARIRAEIRHGELAAKYISDLKPDIVLSGNTPLEAQWRVMKAARAVNSRFVYWMQDVLSVGAKVILEKKFGALGTLISGHFSRLERRMILDSDHVVVITPAFKERIQLWGASPDKISVIPNWGPRFPDVTGNQIEEWKKSQGLADKRLLLYSGTFGLKHPWELAYHAAEKLGTLDDVAVVIIAEGAGMDQLREKQSQKPLNNLHLFPLQPYNLVPIALASAEVLLVLLEADSSGFCVPSKTLTYMSAGRAILGGMPADNLASQLIVENGMGFVVDPTDADGFADRAVEMFSKRDLTMQMGSNSKSYANTEFDIKLIATRFESVLLDEKGRGDESSTGSYKLKEGVSA